MLSTKSRTFPPETKSWGKGCVLIKERPSSPWEDAAVSGSSSTSGNQVTDSEPHTRSRSGKYEQGGPFYTSLYTSDPVPTLASGSRIIRRNGEEAEGIKWSSAPILYPTAAKSAFASAPIPEVPKDTSHLDPYGATAIAACSPANPASEVGTGVSELYHEGLPLLPGVHTWRDRTNLARAAGGEYLNQVFGWIPLVGEIKSFSSTVRHQRDILNQYSRNAGTNVRRTFDFPVEKTEEILGIGEGTCSLAGVSSDYLEPSQPGKYSITSRREVRRWFSGAFTFSVPSQTDTWQRLLGYGSNADILYGASLNPTLLWNLTPWSWAVDWFSNTGDVINNISNYVRAGQVMRYGYMMEETKSSVVLSMSSSGYKRVNAPRNMEKFRVTKVRRPANPFGFGLSFSDLSTEQVLILAALGITLV